LQPGRDRRLVTVAALLGLFLAALEATAVAAAMPSAIGELGGVAHYSWVFSAYLLTSTTTVPLYGKLADLYGRRPVYHVGIALFLVGSALSGAAGSLTQLIAFRAVQGLGAGALVPVAITVVGDIYTLEERGRIQGLFSGMWAVSSLLGPLAGGLITDALSWRWVFYLCIPFGLSSSLLLQRFLGEPRERRKHTLDLAGTALLTVAVTALLVALVEGGEAWGWRSPWTVGLVLAAAVGLVLFLAQERRAPEPTLPLALFRLPVVAVASAGNLLLGSLLFAITAYVPMYAQGVLGGTAADAGYVLAPMLIGWPISATLGAHLILRLGYRPLAASGGVMAVAGAAMLAAVGPTTSQTWIATAMFVLGLGLGSLSMPYLLGVQNAVPWRLRGVATGSVQFFRSMGGAISVAALGALLTARLAATGAFAGGASANALLDPSLRATLAPERLADLRRALLHALQGVYFGVAVLAAVALAIALLVPGGSAATHAHAETADGMGAAPPE
jgi:EmrB/QacA subfamily drug resistance transporter